MLFIKKKKNKNKWILWKILFGLARPTDLFCDCAAVVMIDTCLIFPTFMTSFNKNISLYDLLLMHTNQMLRELSFSFANCKERAKCKLKISSYNFSNFCIAFEKFNHFNPLATSVS